MLAEIVDVTEHLSDLYNLKYQYARQAYGNSSPITKREKKQHNRYKKEYEEAKARLASKINN